MDQIGIHNYTSTAIDGNYDGDVGIRCCFCNRQPMEKEEMIILTACCHCLCAQCYERLTKLPERPPTCPLCLTSSIELDTSNYAHILLN